MKNQFKKTVYIALVFIGVIINAQFSEFGSAVFLQKNGTNAFYNLSGSGVNLIGSNTFSGDLGSFTAGSASLAIKGAEIKTWKEYTSNVCGATLYYLVYKENQRPAVPIFSTFTLPWRENCSGYSFPSGGPCSNQRDQKWGIYDQNIDLTNLAADTYTLEVYISYLGSATTGNGCETTYYVGNYGNNYKMNFTIAASGGVNISGSSFSTNENYIYSRTYLEAVTESNSSAKQAQSISYFDGLGRPKQSIAIKATPAGKDMVTPFEYDGFGRQIKDWLPLPQPTTGNGAINTAPDNSFYSSFTGANLYSEKKLELSPLDRLQEQGHPGTDWNIGSAHTQKFDYDANGDNEVKKYVATFNYTTFTSSISLAPSTDINANNGFYKTSQLYKNKLTDEDGNISYEYKNGKGQTILVRKNDGTNNVDTYYVYNDYNQLAFVIPPLASDKYKNSAAGTSVSSTDLDQLCYQYKYDSQNRLVEKKIPGKGWEYMIYDKQDRLVASQDANMGANKQWLFTKYDQFGRVAYTGIYTSANTYGSAGRVAEQTLADAAGANNTERKTAVSFTQNGQGVYYGNPSVGSTYPSSITTLLSVNYYDSYPMDIVITLPTIIKKQNTLIDTVSNGRSTKSLPTASYVKNIENDNWTRNYTFYDTKARAIGSYSQNHLGGYTKTETELDFAGVPQNTYTNHKRLSTDSETQIKERFTYDSQNRLLQHYHQIDGNTEELLADNTYNEIGQLTLKKVGGNVATPIQSVDYKYNIRGWMTQINDPSSMGNDLFGYYINYNTLNSLFTGTAKYNGNISQIGWITNYTNSDKLLRNYSYTYDALNRLTLANYTANGASSTSEQNYYNEALSYDLNGNIKTLQRFSRPFIGSTAQLIDQLNYTYSYNRLMRVKDNSNNYLGYPSGGNLFSYDANGNMTSQQDKYLSNIQYNYLNLPSGIAGSPGFTNYTYRADGTKVAKLYQYPQVFSDGSYTMIQKTTDYLDGFQYENNILQFIPTVEGYFDFTKNSYIYNYVDHLGNVRLSYYKGNIGNALVLEENNYYPFGLKHDGYNTLTGNPNYQYKYNGKELQETGMTAMDFRHYMPDVGRFIGMDLITEASPNFTPYRFAFNNPIFFSDPTGLYEEIPGGYRITDPNEIGTFLNYLKGNSSASIGDIGNHITGSGLYQLENYVNLDPVVVQGHGNSKTWNSAGNYLFNHYMLENGFNKSAFNWNYSQHRRDYEELINNTAGKKWGEVEKFLFMDVPLFFVGGEIFEASRLGYYAGRGLSSVYSSIITSNTNRVFWSGGEAAMKASINFASKNGAKSLEMTGVGKTLTTMGKYLPWNVMKPLWRVTSSAFANGAEGTANVFINMEKYNAEGIWNTLEKPILESNGTNIVTHTIQ
jgi:RHS repeat-associated protein